MHTGRADPDDWTPWRPERWDFGAPVTSKPLIAAINGYALAGGLELALVCDIRIASPERRFGTPEVKWNLLHGYGAYKLPRIISLSYAMEMLLTGEFIDARHRGAHRPGQQSRAGRRAAWPRPGASRRIAWQRPDGSAHDQRARPGRGLYGLTALTISG